MLTNGRRHSDVDKFPFTYLQKCVLQVSFGRQVEFELIIQCKRKVEREIPFQVSAPGSFFHFTQDLEIFDVFFISQEIQKQLWPAREIWCFPHWHVVHYIAKTLYIVR